MELSQKMDWTHNRRRQPRRLSWEKIVSNEITHEAVVLIYSNQTYESWEKFTCFRTKYGRHSEFSWNRGLIRNIGNGNQIATTTALNCINELRLELEEKQPSQLSTEGPVSYTSPRKLSPQLQRPLSKLSQWKIGVLHHSFIMVWTTH